MAESKPSTSEAAGDAGAGLGRSLTGRSELPAATSSGTQHTRQRSNANRPALEANAGATTAGAAATVKKPQPAVYWNDKKSMDQQRTFFSDSTPPPSPSYAAASNNSASTGYPSAKGAAAAKDGDYDYRYDHVAPPAPIPSRSKRVTKRRLLWGAVGVAIVIIALAIGLGVGLTRNKGSSRGGSDEQDRCVSQYSLRISILNNSQRQRLQHIIHRALRNLDRTRRDNDGELR